MVVIASVPQLEVEESSLRLPDPLGLHELHTGRPLQGLQSTQQLLDDQKNSLNIKQLKNANLLQTLPTTGPRERNQFSFNFQ